MASQVGSMYGFSNLHPSCIKFPFSFVVPAREVSASWFLKQSHSSLGLFTEEGSVGSPAFADNLWLTALVSHCRYLRVPEWIYWSSRAPRWCFWISAGLCRDPKEVLSRLEELLPKKGQGFTDAGRKKALLRGSS